MAVQAEDGGPARPWASVIVVNYNAGRFLQDALDALAGQTERDFEVILVDNASSDGSLNGLRTDQLPHFRLLALPDNTGFAGGNNRAAIIARGHWLALLNPDTKADPDWLAELRKATEAFPDDVSFGGATLNMADPGRLDGAGDCYLGLGIPWRGGYGRPVSELPGIGTCFSPCAASALYRRDLFLELGGFDEDFFCYCEDVDLGFRFLLAGHRSIFWPGSKALHHGSGTTGVASDFAVYHGTRNRLWTFAKNMPPGPFLCFLPLHILLVAALVVRALGTGRARPVARGLWHALKGLPAMTGKRRSIHAQRKAGTWQVLAACSWNWRALRRHLVDVRPLQSRQNQTL